MTPSQEVIDAAKYLGGLLIGVVFWFLRREIDKVGADLASKADKEHMQREIGELKVELKETRDARERDMERLERTNAEKFAEFTASIRDRITTMERNVDGKLDMILKVMDGLRKE